MNLQVQEVTAFLKARHVPVIDEWTVECLDWLKQEYQVVNYRQSQCFCLKTLDTLGNCQRPVFALGVSQHA